MRRVLTAVMVFGVMSGVVRADVRADEKTKIAFEGMLGRIVNMFGGRAARDGLTTTVVVKGERKMTTTGDRAQIVDLAEQKVYDLDLRGKRYTVTTFDELRRQMDEARAKAAEQARRDPDATRAGGDGTREVEIDLDLEESGQRRTVNGFDAREVVMTITAREKAKTLEQNGGMVMTSHIWLAPKIAALDEIAQFDLRYAKALASSAMLDAQQMAMLAGMYPMLQQAMARFEAENVNMDGTPVMTTLKVETVASAEQAAAAAKDEPAAKSGGGLGGLAGGLGARLGRRMMGGNKDQAAAAPGRATVMTMQSETLKVTPAATDADVALPAGFTLK